MRPPDVATTRSNVLVALAAGILGGMVCLWSYGPTILDGTAIDWLLIGDRAPCFLGWHFYRRASETLPLGGLPDLISPVGSSLAFSDAIPWFSIALKPLSPWLPPTYQVVGIWLVLSYVLLGVCACLVLRELGCSRAIALAGSVLVVLSPALARRGGHLSLCAQWLVVAAFLLALRTRRDRTIGRFARRWSPLVAIASGTHPYLAAMVLALGLGACANGTPLARLALLDRGIRDGAHPWPVLLLARAAILVGVTVGMLFLFGYLTGPPGTDAGFGMYSSNLLALIDADGASRVLPSLPRLPDQYEGYAFVGSGAIALLITASVLRWRRGPASVGFTSSDAPPAAAADARELRLLVVVVLAMALYAASTPILLGTWQVATANHFYARLEPLPSIFRASGRFLWPLHYTAIVAAIVCIARLLSPRRACAAVCAAVVLQLVDGASLYSDPDARTLGASNRWNPLRSAAWNAAGDEFDEIRLIPPHFHDVPCTPWERGIDHVPFAYRAGLTGMRINSGHLSRQPRAEMERVCRDTEDEIASGHVDPRVLYVVSDRAMERFTAARLGLATCGRLDGFNVCWSSARRTRFAALVPVNLRPHGTCSDLRRRWKRPAPRA